MSRDKVDQLIESAISEGILPPGATRPDIDSKPWPLVLMIGLGAWLAAVPLFIVMAMLLGDAVMRGAGAYVVGALLLGGAIVNFNRPTQSVFLEQLGLPALLVGGALIAAGVYQDAPHATASLLVAALVCAVAFAVPRAWLRVLLGALACGLIVFTFTIDSRNERDVLWFGAHLALAAWLLAVWARETLPVDGGAASRAATIESAGAGWLLVTLVALAAWSGITFMLSATVGMDGQFGNPGPMRYERGMQLVSALAAAGGAAWLARRWPALRTVWALLVALVMLGLSFLNPTLGAALLVLAVCVTGSRWRLAGAAGLAAAWIIGAFYYQLAMPLATKALVMAGSGALLGAIAWIALARKAKAGTSAPAPDTGSRRGAIALCAVAVFAVVNVGIWQKEQLIGNSRSIFVELAPVDPRSIMQGDYMALNFRLPRISDMEAGLPDIDETRKVVAIVDERGIATMPRLHAGEALAEGEFLIELVRRERGWTMVSDAWHFKEGEADRWAKARYGEFRVDGTGRALLVGLRGPELQAL
jgi:uncharacterized membrane-anchored protein